jgi:hypothetical protein
MVKAAVAAKAVVVARVVVKAVAAWAVDSVPSPRDDHQTAAGAMRLPLDCRRPNERFVIRWLARGTKMANFGCPVRGTPES